MERFQGTFNGSEILKKKKKDACSSSEELREEAGSGVDASGKWTFGIQRIGDLPGVAVRLPIRSSTTADQKNMDVHSGNEMGKNTGGDGCMYGGVSLKMLW